MILKIFAEIYAMPILSALVLVIAFMSGYLILNTVFCNSKCVKNCIFLGFVISVLTILYLTVFNRKYDSYYIELRPFYSFIMAREQVEIYRVVFMNMLLFVPFGMTLPFVLSNQYKKQNVLITVLSAGVLSASIEFLQYRFHLGRCETDDVIFNSFGAAIGTLSYLLYGYIIKRGDSMQMQLNVVQKQLCEICANSLFNKEITKQSEIYDEVINEAEIQTVLPIAYTALKKHGFNDANVDKHFSSIIAQNIRVEYDHNEIHTLLTKNNIQYVILKGAVSASYYKEPLLRTMGDVDILINPTDIEVVNRLMQSIGYSTDDYIHSVDNHIAYKRVKNKNVSVCEVHKKINGIPIDKTNLFDKYFKNIFDSSKLLKTANGECVVPSDFHHGLILLLHTASHLTNEGVGLRHLCDWAVFANGFSNDEFVNLFEQPLKELGLWRFAGLLTLCCIKYLGCDSKSWAGQADDVLLEDIITDILNGGNFGYKDNDRYAQIKYISNRETKKPNKKVVILQAFSSINAKAKSEYNFAKKHKILLPIGWFAVVFDYFILVLTKKRKIDSIGIIKGANHRQSIYNEFKLFENNKGAF